MTFDVIWAVILKRELALYAATRARELFEQERLELKVAEESRKAAENDAKIARIKETLNQKYINEARNRMSTCQQASGVVPNSDIYDLCSRYSSPHSDYGDPRYNTYRTGASHAQSLFGIVKMAVLTWIETTNAEKEN